jgi:hypothetical protein
MGMVQQQQSKCKMELEEELNGYRIGAAQQEDWFSAVIRNTKDPNLRKSFGVLLDLSLAMPGHFLLPYLFFIVVDEFFFVVRHDDGCVCDYNAATRPELLFRVFACSARVVVASHHDKIGWSRLPLQTCHWCMESCAMISLLLGQPSMSLFSSLPNPLPPGELGQMEK